jgi:hypothetical protein
MTSFFIFGFCLFVKKTTFLPVIDFQLRSNLVIKDSLKRSEPGKTDKDSKKLCTTCPKAKVATSTEFCDESWDLYKHS